MREDLVGVPGVEELEPAECGCERVSIDGGVTALHTCEQSERPRDEKLPARLLKPAKAAKK